jgi:antitoxin (DNA-binding transcriptional repressor) of toxin-antitoxin stability system
MTTVSVRDLRNHGDEVLDTVARGESVTVTRDGIAVAELRPLPRRGPSAAQLVERRRHLARIDPERLRQDLDTLLDPAVCASERGVLDTSLLPDEPVVSAISLAELSVGPLITDDPDERAESAGSLHQPQNGRIRFRSAALRRCRRPGIRSCRGRAPTSRMQASGARIRRTYCGDGHQRAVAAVHLQSQRRRVDPISGPPVC